MLRVDIEFYIGTSLRPRLESLRGSMSFGSTRSLDHSSFDGFVEPFYCFRVFYRGPKEFGFAWFVLSWLQGSAGDLV